MSNIPTDLLRTFITVIDERSFTRAARILGVTQPAVSAQIKRLQAILGGDLFDRAEAGLTLTPKGELIVNHARRLLSINDLILHVVQPNPRARMIRIGVPPDFLGGSLPFPLTEYRRQWPDLRFSIEHGGLGLLLNELRHGQLDIAVGLTATAPATEARHQWSEQTVWLRGRATRLNAGAPVPLVSFREDCIYHRTAVNALNRIGRASELVFMGPSIVSLAAAVSAGLGVMALPRSRVRSREFTIWDNAPLPKLPDLTWAVHLREGRERGPLQDLADLMATELRALTALAAKPAGPRPKVTVAFARQAVS
jgi:DNA-binding transcriptional LysR family regulator